MIFIDLWLIGWPDASMSSCYGFWLHFSSISILPYLFLQFFCSWLTWSVLTLHLMPRSLLSHSLVRTCQANLTVRLHMPYSPCVRHLLEIFLFPKLDSNAALYYLNVSRNTGEAIDLDATGLNGGALHIPRHDYVLWLYKKIKIAHENHDILYNGWIWAPIWSLWSWEVV